MRVTMEQLFSVRRRDTRRSDQPQIWTTRELFAIASRKAQYQGQIRNLVRRLP